MVGAIQTIWVGTSILRGWYAQRDRLVQALQDSDILTKSRRRLIGGGRKLQFAAVEEQLYEWIIDRNRKGLRVKDQFIRLKAQSIFHELQSTTKGVDGEETQFKASTGWLERFKTRKNLVSHRQTSARTLPPGADEICIKFIHEVHRLITLHSIKPGNVINMDQVPRYFETEPKSTIAVRGSREVIMRKGGTSHKRFTISFSITGDGKILQPYVLFSKLKNRPSCAAGILVDVNDTRMWSDDILLNFTKNVILSRRETAFSREPVLYIIDSYGSHVKLANSRSLEKYNVFVLLVLSNLTNLLQPLDVAVNPSFQAFYSDQYDNYISRALIDSTLQTRAAEDFRVESLHPPLRALLDENYDPVEWSRQYMELVGEMEDAREELIIIAPQWFLPSSETFSLIECLLRVTDPVEAFSPEKCEAYLALLVDYMKNLDDLKDIFIEEEAEKLISGQKCCDEMVVYAASKLETWNISITSIDGDCKVMNRFQYIVTGSLKEVHLAKIDYYFVLKC
ncbi:hypothetical protein R1sor_016841 [Riccia sorocarpa]|uniref:HTH CENPB-type domain-containing protein n=1 Tax=Riccia sorocarpa TaxID=122646 RepID=A0ABD3HIX4_9MARC